MEDTRRFLRFVIPGITFIIETIFYLLLSNTDWVVTQLSSLGRDYNGVAVLLTTLFLSGGIGFLFNIIHIALYGTGWIAWIYAPRDSREMIRVTNEAGFLRFQDEGGVIEALGDRSEIDSFSRNGIWRIVTTLWHERIESSEIIKGANQGNYIRHDIMHGSGTAFVGSIAAMHAWVFVHYLSNLCLPYGWLGLIPYFVITIHFLVYLRSIPQAYGVVNKMLFRVLREESNWSLNPVIAMVNTDDLLPRRLRDFRFWQYYSSEVIGFLLALVLFLSLVLGLDWTLGPQLTAPWLFYSCGC